MEIVRLYKRICQTSGNGGFDICPKIKYAMPVLGKTVFMNVINHFLTGISKRVTDSPRTGEKPCAIEIPIRKN